MKNFLPPVLLFAGSTLATLSAADVPASPTSVVISQWTAVETKMEYIAPDGQKLPYSQWKVGDWSTPEKAPVLLFFHGAGERGTDNERQLIHGTREILRYSRQHKVKALLLFPQCPGGAQWVDTPWGAPSHKLPPESKSMRLAMAMLDQELKDPQVDPNRVYVAGISMGGFGTWDAISRYPGKFAAAFPVCGGADLEQAPRLTDIPILVYHGDSDTTVLTQRSRDIVQAIKAAGGTKIQYVEVPKCGHCSWGQAFAKEQNWTWLFQQKKR